MRRSAYTLVEVLLATAIMAVVLLGAQSAVVIASRAIPTATSGPSAVAAAGTALGLLGDDLGVATAITTATATAVQFTVPDRTGDAIDDTIRYQWSGTPGDPLERVVNGGKPAVVASGVQSFTLAYDTAQVALPTTWSEGPETTLVTLTGSTSLTNGVVQSNRWWAQYFKPTLSASARSWTVTRITFKATKNSNNSGKVKAQIRPDAAGKPGAQVLGEWPIFESSLDSSWTVIPANYACVSGLTPGQGLWFELQWVADTEALDFQYYTSTFAVSGGPLMMSANNGSTWSTVGNSQMLMTVYGTVCMPDAVKYRTAVAGVRCTLRTGTTAGSGISQSWRILNQPTAPP